MIFEKSQKEISNMKEGGKILAKVFQALKKEIKPGIKTAEIDKLAHDMILKHNAKPSFLDYEGYPNSVCTSINNEVVHGIPGERELKEGDIIGLDIGVFYKGMHTDAAITLPVGKISAEDQKLLEIAKKSLFSGLKEVKRGNYIGDISFKIQNTVESEGYSVVKDCTGHGIGKDLHEDPSIPNFGDFKTGAILKEGYTLAIEPMVNQGTYKVKTEDDGWTIVTEDGKKSAHFELTVLVKKEGYENLTPILS